VACELRAIVRAKFDGFSGWAGSVGTAEIDGKSARNWLKDAVAARTTLTVHAACESLAGALTAAWKSVDPTHLSVFVAGFEATEPRFWVVSNGDVPDGVTAIPPTFEALNDLDEQWFPQNRLPGETKAHAIARVSPVFRRGVLRAATIFDVFTEAIVKIVAAGHPEIPPLDSLERYAAYALFRIEFTKRVYDWRKGIGVDPHPPIARTIYVVSVDPIRCGARAPQGRNEAQASRVEPRGTFANARPSGHPRLARIDRRR
jgi:hypothetical protein